MVDELANETTKLDQAGRTVTRCHHDDATLLNKRQHLDTLIDQVALAQQAAHLLLLLLPVWMPCCVTLCHERNWDLKKS